MTNHAETQVYWHEIPSAPPPWTNERTRKRLRERAAEVAERVSNIYGCTKDERFHLNSKVSTETVSVKSQARRLRRHLRHKLRAPHFGVVPEPHMTPLMAINLTMKELKQQPFTLTEVEEAVDRVVSFYAHMSGSQHGVNGKTSALRRRRRATWGSSVLSSQPSQGPSSQHMESVGGSQSYGSQAYSSQPAPLTLNGMKHSLVLEVMKELCSLRPELIFTSKTPERKGLCIKVAPADVVPHKRVVVMADCRMPHFVVYSRRPRVGGVGQQGTVTAPRNMQILSVGQHPTPWRALLPWRGPHSPPLTGCSVAVIERRSEVNDRATRHENLEDEQFTGGMVGATSSQGISWAPHGQRLRAVKMEAALLGGGMDDVEMKVKVKVEHPNSDSDDEMDAADSSAQADARLEEIHYRRLFGPEDKMEDDPLLRIPEVSCVMRGRHWMERLLSTACGDRQRDKNLRWN